MNKTAIKNFAIWARVQLIESAKQRAYEYEITESGEYNPRLETVGGRLLTQIEKEQRWQLIARIRQKGYDQVMEEAAYTWFNRFIALRFMEVNGYLPSKVRVFTDESGAFKPEILKEAMSIELEGLDRGLVLELLDKQDNETLYKHLLIAQCNALNSGLPYMFEKIANWTELLFPANLLRPDSVIGTMISSIPEEDWTDAVQIIGWLYQYYNSELKDETFALLKKNVKINKERIPAATQLFTPDWIVRYMVENSLGRLWYEGHRDFDKSGWKYYLDEAEQEPEVERQLQAIRAEYAQLKPEDIKVIDPCMGSGHILVYAFDVLMQIYTAAGWSERDAAQSIVENNLYGLDIDDRAAQLAYFAVMMKARQYDRRALTRGYQPNVYAIQPSQRIDPADLRCYGKLTDKAQSLYFTFAEAKEFGSILKMPATVEEIAQLRLKGKEILNEADTTTLRLDEVAINRSAVQAMDALFTQAEVLAKEYDVVITNPPYLGSKSMSPKLASYVQDRFNLAKFDLFSVFMLRGLQMVKKGGFSCLVTMQSWMFLSSFEKMRNELIFSHSLCNLMHMGNMVMGIAFGTCVSSFRKMALPEYRASFVYVDFKDICDDLPLFFPPANNRNGYKQSLGFTSIPGNPIAYWAGQRAIQNFVDYPPIGSRFELKQGLITADNERFLRQWSEVPNSRLITSALSINDFIGKNGKWLPYNKGGEYRKWYGNNELVVNWESNGFEIRNFKDNNGKLLSRPQNIQFFGKEGASWSIITNGCYSLRYTPTGFGFDARGSMMFSKAESIYYALALMCSNVARYYLDFLSPTVSFEVGNVSKVPFIFHSMYSERIEETAKRNVTLSKKDWDSFETSWDFQCHPLIVPAIERHYMRLSDCWKEWESTCDKRFIQLKANEEELNRIFIDIYGLQDELSPDVADKDVTVRKADLGRDIRSLISYAVGCMLGRYSVDVPGLVFAGGNFDDTYLTAEDPWMTGNGDTITTGSGDTINFRIKHSMIVHDGKEIHLSYRPDEDGILPITDDEYFDDDIVGLFVNWVHTVYGSATLEENLKFIADALGGRGTPREVLRQYFLNDFYKDHLKVYQKRPIYWLFSSGKKNGFKCLVYMHRYQPDLLARIRTDYVHEQQERYRTQLTMLEDSLQTAAASQRVKLNKQLTKIKDQALELQQYEEKIHHLADQMIEIDLDDGVKVNYAKFQDVLEKIK